MMLDGSPQKIIGRSRYRKSKFVKVKLRLISPLTRYRPVLTAVKNNNENRQ